MKNESYAYCFFFFLICACKGTNQEEVVFTGFDLFSQRNPILFDTLSINPIMQTKEYFGNSLDSNLFWEIFNVNSDEGVFLKSSSQNAVAAGVYADSLFFKNHKFSVTKLFKEQPIRYRIIQVLRFKFQDANYYVLVGRDKDEGGNRAYNNKILLVEIRNESVKAFCPPLKLDYGLSNVRGDLSDYFCDLNGDEYLDFLQINDKNKIHVYSLQGNTFVKQKEFIQLYQKSELESIFYIDKSKSNWPYPIHNGAKKQTKVSEPKFDPSYY